MDSRMVEPGEARAHGWTKRDAGYPQRQAGIPVLGLPPDPGVRAPRPGTYRIGKTAVTSLSASDSGASTDCGRVPQRRWNAMKRPGTPRSGRTADPGAA